MGWGAEQADAITKAEEKVRKDRDWHLYASGRIKAECRSLFCLLSDQISAYVKEFTEARGDRSIDCKREDGSIEVTKASIPTKYLRLSLDSGQGFVTVFKRTTDGHSAATNECDKLSFAVDKDGIVHFYLYADYPMLAQHLLSDVFGSCLPDR
jgi:hypothetical protein